VSSHELPLQVLLATAPALADVSGTFWRYSRRSEPRPHDEGAPPREQLWRLCEGMLAARLANASREPAAARRRAWHGRKRTMQLLEPTGETREGEATVVIEVAGEDAEVLR
jgi:hypothetical protein